METCPGWQYGFQWQNSMFENMSTGMTIKNAFDTATARYLTISPAVVFLGDQNLIVPHPPSKPTTPSDPDLGKIGKIYSYSTGAIDVNDDRLRYGWDWNSDNMVDQWDDNNGHYYESGATITTSHLWMNNNIYHIKVKAEDINAAQSEWSDPLTITMPRDKIASNTLLFSLFEQIPLLQQLLLQRFGLQ